jgi:aminopeptidase N
VTPSRIACLLCLGPCLLQADTYPRQPGIEPIHYIFRIQLKDGADDILGEADITLRVRQAGTREAWLDLAGASGGRGMTVSSVTSGGSGVAFSHAENRLRLPLPATLKAGQEITFHISYGGIPANGLRMLKNKHGERTFFSENWPDHARDWLPVVDHISAKVSGEFIVTAPSHYQVVSNGRLVEQTDLPDGMRRTHWSQTVPIPVWLYTLGVARFSVHHAGLVRNVPLQSWVFPQERGAWNAFELPARKAVDFFSEKIAPFPFEKLANVEAAGIRGGMESATAIFYGESSLNGRPITGLVVHEIAHQWFGDSVTEADWDDVWLSEGFATYLTLLFTEHDEGRDAFMKGLERSRAQVLAAEQRTPDTPIIHRNLADMGKVLNPFVYQKAGWVLHMLRRQVGTETFWKGLRTYYQRFQGGTASTADFRAVMAEVSGQDLDGFFTQWLARSGVPRIEGTWVWDPEGKKVAVDLAQTQAGEPYRLSLDLGVGDAIRKVELMDRTVHVEFPAEKAPASLTLDPQVWTLFAGKLVRQMRE